MLRSRLDRAFVRYARTGDPRALARVFDGSAGELYRLGFHLLGDRHAADDLVQQTFVVAIEQAKSFDGSRGVLPWLCGILTNRALHLRRQARQRAANVRAAPGTGAVVDPVAEAAARETSTTVAAAVRSLPEPYRQVLLLHLVHELAPKEVAEALARPDATVRTQLARGLELLRRALPVGVAGFAAGQVPAPLGLVGVRDAVLAHAERVAASASAAGGVVGASVVVFSGVVAMKKVLLGVVLVAAVVFMWSLWPGQPNGPLLPAPPRSAVASTIAAELRADAAPAAAPPVERREAAAAADPTQAGLEVHVRWADGAPATDVAVRCRPRPYHVEAWLHVAHTGADGIARFVGLPPGSANALTNRGVDADVELVPGALARVEIELPAGIDVRGRVVHVDGRPFAGATVAMSIAPATDDGEPVGVTGPDGTFTVRAAGHQHVLTASAPGFATAKEAYVRGPDVLLTMRPAPGTIVGTVVDPDGHAVANARVLVGLTMAESGPTKRGVHQRLFGEITGQDCWPARFLRTDAEGRFRCEGLPPWRWPVWVGAPGWAPFAAEVEVRDSGETAMAVRLTPGATIRGRIVDEAGAPIVGEWVYAYRELGKPDPRVDLGMFRFMVQPLWAVAARTTDSDGRFDIPRVAPGAYRLHVVTNHASALAHCAIAEGETFVWDATVAADRRPSMHGVLVDADGAPAENWHVRIAAPGDRDGTNWFGLLAEGAFRGNPVDEGVRYRIIVRPWAPMLGDELDLGEFTAADCPLRLVVPRDRVPAIRLRGRVLVPEGLPAARCSVQVSRPGSGTNPVDAECAADGTWHAGPVVPGRYELRAVGSAFGSVGIGTFDVVAGADRDFGSFVVPAPGTLVVTAVDARGERRADVGFGPRAIGPGPHRSTGYRSFAQRDGIGRGNLPPGRWLLTSVEDSPFAAMEVEVRAGATTDVRFVIPDGVRFRVRVPALAREQPRLRACWTTADGVPIREHYVDTDEAGTEVERIAPPGRYTIEVADYVDRTRAASVTFELRADDPAPVVELPLPPLPPASPQSPR